MCCTSIMVDKHFQILFWRVSVNHQHFAYRQVNMTASCNNVRQNKGTFYAWLLQYKWLHSDSGITSHQHPRQCWGGQNVYLNWHLKFKGGLGPVANVCRGPKSYSYATAFRSILIHCVPKKVSPLNILQQPPQTCTDLNEILHTQDDIYFCHRRQIS